MTTPILAAESLAKLKAATTPVIGMKSTTTYKKGKKTIVEERAFQVTGLQIVAGAAVGVGFLFLMDSIWVKGNLWGAGKDAGVFGTGVSIPGVLIPFIGVGELAGWW